MRAKVVKVKTIDIGRRCDHCNKTFRIGDVLLTQTFNLARGHGHTIRYHKACLARLVERAPEDETAAGFRRAREELLAEIREGHYVT